MIKDSNIEYNQKKKDSEFFIQFGKNLRQIRQEQNMTISDLSKYTGIKEEILKNAENGNVTNIRATHFYHILKALNTTSVKLFKNT